GLNQAEAGLEPCPTSLMPLPSAVIADRAGEHAGNLAGQASERRFFEVGHQHDADLAIRQQEEHRAHALLAATVQDLRAVVLPGDDPAQAVGRELAIAGLLPGKDLVARLLLDQSVGQYGNGEARQVLGGSTQAAAGNLVTRVSQAAVTD